MMRWDIIEYFIFIESNGFGMRSFKVLNVNDNCSLNRQQQQQQNIEQADETLAINSSSVVISNFHFVNIKQVVKFDVFDFRVEKLGKQKIFFEICIDYK